MTTQGYPEHLDLEWAAIDSIGQLGIFFSAGSGPIARAFLDREEHEQDAFSACLQSLPACGGLIRTGGFGDDAVYELAHRGCYVFDWSDVHRSAAESLMAYELCAVPTSPLKLGDLLPIAREFLESIVLDNVVFGDQPVLNVAAHIECLNRQDQGPDHNFLMWNEGLLRKNRQPASDGRRHSPSIIKYLRWLLPS